MAIKWSRLSGGSGAPGWTFEVVGLDPKQFVETGAAVLHDRDEPIPMLWPTNYIKLASATMFTIFFAGNTFCPLLRYKGQSAQDFLQSHYIAAYEYLATYICFLLHLSL